MFCSPFQRERISLRPLELYVDMVTEEANSAMVDDPERYAGIEEVRPAVLYLYYRMVLH